MSIIERAASRIEHPQDAPAGADTETTPPGAHAAAEGAPPVADAGH
ncbi:hypothetical protein GTP77_28350, partial [Massilia sp. FT127W]|nr:hypothetical protein [Pseudoduganella aquatica]